MNYIIPLFFRCVYELQHTCRIRQQIDDRGWRRHLPHKHQVPQVCIDYNIVFKSKESKTTRGHNLTLVKEQSRLDVGSVNFHRGPSMYGIHYQLIVYMLVVLICSRTE